jgi:hypothetical protein
MLWVKLHTDILSDPKLMRAALRGAKHLHLLPWLLVFAKNSRDSGRISIAGEPAEPELIAAAVPGVKPKQIVAAMRELEEIGVLSTDDDGAKRFVNWDKRAEKPSDHPSAVKDRVHRLRERKRDGNAGETRVKRVTPSIGNATEGEEEEEEEEEGEEEGDSNNNNARGEFAEGALGHELTTRLLERVRHQRSAWSLSITDAMHGVPGFTLSPAQLRTAVTDYLANDESPNLGRFRGYLQRAAATPPPTAEPRRSAPQSAGARMRANTARALASLPSRNSA